MASACDTGYMFNIYYLVHQQMYRLHTNLLSAVSVADFTTESQSSSAIFHAVSTSNQIEVFGIEVFDELLS